MSTSELKELDREHESLMKAAVAERDPAFRRWIIDLAGRLEAFALAEYV